MQLRRTGSTGLHGLPSDAGPLEWAAGGMFIAGLLMGGLAPLDRQPLLGFPGERNVPLASASFSVHLVHAMRS